MSLKKIASILKTKQDITIVTHISPDGDALGSSFALHEALRCMGIASRVVLTEPLPTYFSFTHWQPTQYTPDMQAETVVALDCGDPKRLGEAEALLSQAQTILMIDHHKTGIPFGDVSFVDPACSATGEIVFSLLSLLQVPLTPETAAALYIAISTDTGGFRFANTTSQTHQIVSRLLTQPFDAAKINRFLYDCVPYAKLKLTALALDSLELYADGKIAVLSITLDMLRQSGAAQEDTEGLTDYTRMVQGVEIGILLKEKDRNEVKISLRSNEYADVSNVAKLFGGGGHYRASGCVISAAIAQAKEQIVAAAAQAL